MKRPFSFRSRRSVGTVVLGTALVAATYGLVRLAYGLLLPDVQSDLGLGATAAGLTSAGASLLYCVGAVVGFVAADRRPRALVAAAALTAGPGALLMAAAPGAEVFAAGAVVASAGAGLASPAMVSLVRRAAPPADEARSQNVVNAGTGPGLVGAGLLALVLLPDWRLAWSVVGVATLAIGAGLLLVAPTSDGRPRSAAAGGVPTWSWFRRHRTLMVAALLLGAGSAATWNYGRALLVAEGVGATLSVVAWIALGLGGAAVIATAGALGRLAPRSAWVVTTVALASATLVLGVAGGSAPVALLAAALFGWAYTAGTGGLIVWTTCIDAGRAPAGTSLLFVLLVLGQAVGAAAVGVVVDLVGHEVAFVAAAVVALLAVPVAWRAPGGTTAAGRTPSPTQGLPVGTAAG